MARIERVGHVVLYVTDVAKAVDFYRDKLGMEVVRWTERPGAFMSFGRQHHDIGLFTARNDERASAGAPGLSHVAFVIEGGTEELKATFDDLSGRGVEFIEMIDYGYTRSMYCNDPDGNRIELYCELLEPLAGKRFLASRSGVGKKFKWEEVLESDGSALPGASALHTGALG
jgi:catechol 2,3-dioxygenase